MIQETTSYGLTINGKDYGVELTYNPAEIVEVEDFIEDSFSVIDRNDFTLQEYCDAVMEKYPNVTCKEFVSKRK